MLGDATPSEVIEAAWHLNAESFDLAAVGWECGTTVLLVYKWDSTTAVRQTLSDDLSRVVSADYIPKPKHSKRSLTRS